MQDSSTVWPRPLQPATGPFRAEKIDGALDGMGAYGDATRTLGESGIVQPDMVTGMTLFLIANQPRRARGSAADGDATAAQSNGVSGGVWVRERFTIHAPVRRSDAFTVSGEATGTYARKGRRYSTTASMSVDETGRRFATNLTTGLLTYRADPQLADGFEGLLIEDTPAPGPDWEVAAENPHLTALRAAAVGDVHGGTPVEMSLAMMTARDTSNPDNPIHSDPEAAKKTGLRRPIAGGSHVLAMPMEAAMGAYGPESLLHGTYFDIRWKAPTEDGIHLIPTATVVAAGSDDSGRRHVTLELRAELVDGPTAMVGTAIVPIR